MFNPTHNCHTRDVAGVPDSIAMWGVFLANVRKASVHLTGTFIVFLSTTLDKVVLEARWDSSRII